jgi:hypothetical protein
MPKLTFKIKGLSTANVINLFSFCLSLYIYIYGDNHYDYQRTLIDANHYYETSPYKAKKNIQNPKREKYKVVNHGYLVCRWKKSQ